MWFWILVIILLLTIRYLSLRRDNGGPPGIHGIGVLPFIYRINKEGSCLTHDHLIREFGDIVSVKLFNKTMIFLGSHRLHKEAYSKLELSDRPGGKITHGLIVSNGRLWRDQRRFALSTLRDFGMGKFTLEQKILQECTDLINQFNRHQKLDPKFFIGCAVTNVICSVIFSTRYNYGDEILTDFLEMITHNLSTPHRTLIQMLPISRFLPSIRASVKRVDRNREKISQIVQRYIREHRETFHDGDIRDYIDAYLQAMQRETHEDSTFTDAQLVRSVHDLFVAGSETTGTTLRWALALMAQNPNVQDQVYNEIMNIIGNDRLPNMSDKLKMPYTEAVLLEIQRYGSIVPMIVHRANSETALSGYRIEKDSIIFVNSLQLNRDKRVWNHPEEFNVSNFLRDGEVINRNNLVAFSVGKRSCLGESLAKMELFLFFVSLMQKFRFYFDENEPDLTKPEMGVIRMPPPYVTGMEKRQ